METELQKMTLLSKKSTTLSRTSTSEQNKFPQIYSEIMKKSDIQNLESITDGYLSSLSLNKYYDDIIIKNCDQYLENNINDQFADQIQVILESCTSTDCPLHDGYNLYDCKATKWLPDDNQNRWKPDLFLINGAFATPGKNSSLIGVKSAVPCLPGMVKAVLEGKNVKLSDIEKGKLLFYLQCLNNFQDTSCGLLFNSSNYIFAIMKKGIITSIYEGLWEVIGSVNFIMQQIEIAQRNSIATACDKAMLKFVNDANLSPIQEYCFLGAGASGRVLKVQDTSKQHFLALKLIPCYNICTEYSSKSFLNESQILNEFKTLKSMNTNNNVKSIVVEIESHDLLCYEHSSDLKIYGYVIKDVGNKIITLSKKQKMKMLDMLNQLHSNGFIHGDPRYSNIIITKDKLLKWIDCRDIGEFSEENIEKDLYIFVKDSYGIDLRKYDDEETHKDLREVISEYCQEKFNLKNPDSSHKVNKNFNQIKNLLNKL